MARIALKNPAKGSSAIADAIRERRGARGLTPLDQTLLNAPEVANGWNVLVGALRNRNSLPGDIRELMILRVAARNRAVFEWIHHAHVGLDEGLTPAQLTVIRDTASPLASIPDLLSPFQKAALRFADHSTTSVSVPEHVLNELKSFLSDDQQLLEATTVVAGYNMVSRVLVALDVGDALYDVLPLPESDATEHDIQVTTTDTVSVTTFKNTDKGDSLPWIVFVNSLLTTKNMWQYVLPRLSTSYNLIIYDQRGHGRSSIPAHPITLDDLSDDIPAILKALKIPTPIHAVIGVSQGGATTLNAAKRNASLAHKFVVCDTQATSPEANIKAWNDRIALAEQKGVRALADATIPRWFGDANPNLHEKPAQALIYDQVANTPLEGFKAGAKTLQGYDLAPGLVEQLRLHDAQILFLAGEKDGGLPKTLEALSKSLSDNNIKTRYEVVKNAGHLPMVDQPGAFLDIVTAYLGEK